MDIDIYQLYRELIFILIDLDNRDWVVGSFFCQFFPFAMHANLGITLLNILNVTIIR